ncbi:response regulator [Desulfofundulus thermobenzoicus]|uniref:Stage 0 sporulation protein A homolog n=1 Tax=Desulfofundulus thermobenzoicus TaxID=29376 RepID=A0A6N7IVC7_9FIRM|nr:response regulator transcription factor [Desulfofundulus thermobenzoicus]MQL53459.1 response regulator [Desulfofundulus thermobenzoicus]HHW44779.1 response regulator transcription factor [Desulfotomaculum sp.]
MARILLVDDEISIKRVVEQTLEREGFAVDYAADGLAARDLFARRRPDLVILDVMLPEIDGFELCRRWREVSDVPILILSAKGDIVDKSVGFNCGADDYLTKPFSPVELVLRVKALLRRSRQGRTDRVETAGLQIDASQRRVWVDGREVELTPKEFDLLWFLARHPGRVFTREQIFEHVWGDDVLSDLSTVTVFMRRLREKIEADPRKPRYLKTIWGVGYKFVAG